MEKISEEFPSAIIREGGLAALLNYLDFFSIAVQRTALQAAANCCRNVSSEHFHMVKGVWPIIRGCLSYSDQRLVEFACLCVIRVVDSYHRSSIENLQLLVDRDLIKAVNQLLLPAGGSPLIASNTFTLLLRALATCARASSKITISLLEADIVDTLYQILTGILPSATSNNEGEQGDAIGGQGLGGGLADMAVMENLAHRPKDQVEETLSLISELLPPLPKGMRPFQHLHPVSADSWDKMAYLITRLILRNLWRVWLRQRQRLIELLLDRLCQALRYMHHLPLWMLQHLLLLKEIHQYHLLRSLKKCYQHLR